MPGSPETNAHCAAPSLTRMRRLRCIAMAALLLFGQSVRAEPVLERLATPYRAPTAAGSLPYFVAHARSPQPRSALVVMHGHPRDAARTLQAAIDAAQGAGDSSLLVAPLFQVPVKLAAHCHSAGLPQPQDGDALWRCGSWIEGDLDNGGKTGSFNAMDNLLADLKRRWPSLQSITVAGFPPAPSSCSIMSALPSRHAECVCAMWWPIPAAGSILIACALCPPVGETAAVKKPAVFAGKRWTPAIVRRPTDGNTVWKRFPLTCSAPPTRLVGVTPPPISPIWPPPRIPAPRRAPTIGYLTNPAPPSCRAPIDCSAPWPTPTTIGITWRRRSRIG